MINSRDSRQQEPVTKCKLINVGGQDWGQGRSSSWHAGYRANCHGNEGSAKVVEMGTFSNWILWFFSPLLLLFSLHLCTWSGRKERNCYNYANTKSTLRENNNTLKFIVDDCSAGRRLNTWRNPAKGESPCSHWIFFFSSSYWKHRGYGPKDKETAFLAMLSSNPEHITHEKIKKINTNKKNEIKIADKNNDAIPIVYGTK